MRAVLRVAWWLSHFVCCLLCVYSAEADNNTKGKLSVLFL